MKIAQTLHRMASLGLTLAALTCTAPAWADAYVDAYTIGIDHPASGPISASSSASQNTAQFTGQAFASADLNPGTLRASISGSYTGSCCFTGYDATAYARITDGITFHGSGSTVPVNVVLDVDGIFAMSGVSGVSLLSYLRLGSTQSYLQLSRRNDFYGGSVLSANITGGSPGSFLDKTLDNPKARMVISLTVPTNVYMPFFADLQLQGQGSPPNDSFSADFTHTAQISLSLPQGYSFTSTSGHFLTTPVPVPGAAWLLGSGLLGLIGLARRKQTGLPQHPASRGQV